MDEKATGVILRVRPLTETSLIIHWLTEEVGRIATVAKGARRPKSPFRGKLDLFFAATFTYQPSRRSELHTLRELEILATHSSVRTGIDYLQQCSYGAALIERVTETETPIPEIYQLFREFLAHFSLQPKGPLPIFAFELKLLNALGLQPDLAETKISEGSRKILEQCLLQPWQVLTSLRLSLQQQTEIQQFLISFLLFHIGQVPSGRATAIEA